MSTSSKWINVDDIIGRPYRAGAVDPDGLELDCVGVCATALERLGALRARDELLRAAMDATPLEHWQEVDRMIDSRIGDIVLSEPDGGNGSLHVSCIVREGPPIALSTCRKIGAFISPALYIRQVIGIYRACVAPETQ